MNKLISKNKKAYHDYEILDELEVGIKLLGSEVKSVKEGSVSLKESFVRIEGGELIIKNMHISPYKFARNEEYKPDRDRKLLANKKEIERIYGKMTQDGLSIVPIKIYLKGSLIKLEIALGRGKKKHDKRQDMKKKEDKKEMKRILK